MMGSTCRKNWLPVSLILYILFAILNPRRFAVSHYKYESLRDFERQMSTSLQTHLNETEDLKPLCPALAEVGFKSISSLKQNRSFWSQDDVEDFDEKTVAQSFSLELGGIWSPKTCNPVHHISLIVPYRDRPVQLKKFLLYMHQFLQLQLVRYKIIIIEQKDEQPFNRGKLLNVGFVEAIKQGWFHCFVFHDVDLLPENLYNMYGCTQKPRHLSALCNKFRYTLQYPEVFGGVVSITKDIFQKVNGFSNNFFGWGGEDDDLYSRLTKKGIDVVRLTPSISTFRMLSHVQAERTARSYGEKRKLSKNQEHDGLNSLRYFITNHIATPLYTLIQVKI